jgi:hypothetical protein
MASPMRTRNSVVAPLSLAALVAFGTVSAGASTFACQFGTSSGVGFRNGIWEKGDKPGDLRIAYRRDGHFARGTRRADGEDAIAATLVIGARSLQFISTWEIAPGKVVEVASIEANATTYVAVRTVHAAGGIGGPSALTDYGTCELRP